jgi:hypothetical protein
MNSILSEHLPLILGKRPNSPENYRNVDLERAGSGQITGALLRSSTAGGRRVTAVSFVVDGRLYARPAMGNIRN